MGDTLGSVLRDFRKRQGMTQVQLAEQTGLERTYISMLERSVYMPTVKTFCAYCEGLGVLPSTVMSRIEERLGPSENWPATHPPEKSPAQ